MKLRLFASTLVVGFAMTAAAAVACPCKKAAKKSAPVTKAETAAVKTVVTVADKPAATSATKPCCAKSAGTVAVKTPATPSAKPCCAKTAVTAAAKTPVTPVAKPCCAKTAVTVADKVADGRSDTVKVAKTTNKGGCNHPCGGAKTVVASSKTPCKKPCGAAKTATASGKSPCGGAKTASASASGDCPIGKKVSAVLASMPSMKYRVGEEVTGCSKSAAAMAEKAHTSVAYVVGDETFKSEGEATVKLASLLEAELDNLQAIQYVAGGKCMRCPMTAKGVAKTTGSKLTYRVGGVDFEDKASADKVAKLVSDAVASVSMKYKVGAKSFCCDKMAGEAAKDKGAKITYIVGDQETSCSASARAMLTRAKARKAVETAVKSSFSL